MLKPFSVSVMLLLFMAGGLSAPMTYAEDGEPKKKDTTRVCKRIKQTGTHFTRRVCFTRARWDEMRRDAQEEMSRVHNLPEAQGEGG